MREETTRIIGTLMVLGALYLADSSHCAILMRGFSQNVAEHGPGPGQPQRYEQERDLFGFFSSAVSAFDAFAFGMFAVGGLLNSNHFALRTEADERNVSWKRTTEAFSDVFPGCTIAVAMEETNQDVAFKSILRTRNYLSHRAIPPRSFGLNVGTGVRYAVINEFSLDVTAQPTRSGRQDVARMMGCLMTAASQFTEAHFR